MPLLVSGLIVQDTPGVAVTEPVVVPPGAAIVADPLVVLKTEASCSTATFTIISPAVTDMLPLLFVPFKFRLLVLYSSVCSPPVAVSTSTIVFVKVNHSGLDIDKGNPLVAR